MSNGKTGLVLSLFLCASMTALIFAGCGAGGVARVDNPLDFFFQTRENMQTVASFRMKGDMVMELTGMPGDETVVVNYDMVCEQKIDGEMLARMDMDFEGPGSLSTVAYITEDRMYMEMPGGMWVYEEVDLSSELAEMGQGMGPQYVMEVLDMAESAEVVAEDDIVIAYQLVFDVDELIQEQELELEEMKEDLRKEGLPEEYVAEFVEIVKQVLSGMEYLMLVDKKSGLAIAFKMNMEIDLSAFAELFPGETMPDNAKATVSADLKMSDYGKTFNIQLPKEAEDAIPMEELERLAET